MSITAEQVFIEALSLPTRTRAALVEKLLLSLESEAELLEAEAAWKQEAADRCKAYDAGELKERET